MRFVIIATSFSDIEIMRDMFSKDTMFDKYKSGVFTLPTLFWQELNSKEFHHQPMMGDDSNYYTWRGSCANDYKYADLLAIAVTASEYKKSVSENISMYKTVWKAPEGYYVETIGSKGMDKEYSADGYKMIKQIPLYEFDTRK